ncbi:MAG: tyrosine-type recombinase/integrase [Actinomycetia bacterium]|nr:tyrosine-type recombinase/integrase [Actinomycetes bacterium]
MAKGSIRLKREPDYWELRVYAGRDPVTNKRRYVSRGFRGGKREANNALAQLVAEVDREGIRTEATISRLLNTHIDHLATRGRQQRTIDGYRSIARAIAKDPLGNQPLKKVTVKTVDDFYDRLAKRGLSPATIQRYHALMGAAYQQAMAWSWAPTNTVRLATPPSVPRMPRKIPTSETVAAILREAEASRNPENYLAFRLLATTGARRGEICGLRWNAIDQETVDQLREHRADQNDYIAEVRSRMTHNAFVLADLLKDPSGATPIPPNRLTQAFRRITDRVPEATSVRLHDLRHWFASTQLDSGEPLPAVAARIGDNVETLAKVYAHKGQRSDDKAAQAIADQLTTPENGDHDPGV